MEGAKKAEANPKFGGSSPWAAEFWLHQGRCSACKRGNYRQLPCRTAAKKRKFYMPLRVYFTCLCGSILNASADLFYMPLRIYLFYMPLRIYFTCLCGYIFSNGSPIICPIIFVFSPIIFHSLTAFPQPDGFLPFSSKAFCELGA